MFYAGTEGDDKYRVGGIPDMSRTLILRTSRSSTPAVGTSIGLGQVVADMRKAGVTPSNYTLRRILHAYACTDVRVNTATSADDQSSQYLKCERVDPNFACNHAGVSHRYMASHRIASYTFASHRLA